MSNWGVLLRQKWGVLLQHRQPWPQVSFCYNFAAMNDDAQHDLGLYYPKCEDYVFITDFYDAINVWGEDGNLERYLKGMTDEAKLRFQLTHQGDLPMTDTPEAERPANGKEQILNMVTALMEQMRHKTSAETGAHMMGQLLALQVAVGLMISADRTRTQLPWQKVVEEVEHWLIYLKKEGANMRPGFREGAERGLEMIGGFADLGDFVLSSPAEA